jgi:hypothetical protein
MIDKVKIIDNAIDETLIYRFLNLIDKDKFITIDKSAYAHTQTDFQIKFYKDDFHINPAYLEMRSAILEKVSQVSNCSIPCPKVYRNFMLKYNNPGMRSALHVEHKDIHGHLGFLFYLSTEDSGYLRWVDKQGEDKYFQEHPDEKQDFVNNYSYRQLYGDIQVQPVFNRLVVFETFGSHLVDTLKSSKNELPRLCVMGWPFCEI